MNELKELKNMWDEDLESIKDIREKTKGIRGKIEDILYGVLNKHGVIKVDLSEFGDEDYVCAGLNNWGWCKEVRLNKSKHPIDKIHITLKDGNLECDFGLLDLYETKDMFLVADRVVKVLENNECIK